MVQNTAPNGIGGAICLQTSSLVITPSSCHFQSNMAASGGAIYTSLSSLTISPTPATKSCLFQDNAASDQGGAILGDIRSTLLLQRISLQGNQAFSSDFSSGGAIAMAGSSLTMSDSIAYSNQAGIGGALFLSSSTATLTNVLMANNNASSQGGAVSCEGSSFALSSILWLQTCNLRNNQAARGGAISINSCWTKVSLGSIMSSNRALLNGGAMEVLAITQPISVSDSVIAGNQAKFGGFELMFVRCCSLLFAVSSLLFVVRCSLLVRC
jgi:predicted outer membrane repeat protein